MDESKEQLTAAGLARCLSDDLGFGDEIAVFRLVRHLTAQGLLETVGAVNTGSGRRRLYERASLSHAAILLKLQRLGAPVGVMREVIGALKRGLRKDRGTSNIINACKGMEQPTLFILVPTDRKHGKVSVHLRDGNDGFEKIYPDSDFFVIRIGRFL
jgi:hypothetical protein